ncbi:lipoate-protein ligase A [Paracidovorax wautersii]|uniref:Lipoate-protein ligase A n=1 Tax=Paracidovorax wautersii TaxID=1177982 RepID=A0ABU1I6D9_9BURK|nr:lipoate-protein ligase A [Paracidovorax wautersii]
MAYDIDADKMLEVLRIGKEKLSDKGTTSAKKRVDPLRSQTGLPRESVVAAMTAAFAAQAPLAPVPLDERTLQQARTLAQERFASAEWTALVP